MASSGRPIDLDAPEPTASRSALRTRATRRAVYALGAWRSEGAARWLFIWPAVLLILFMSVFPLVGSVALSLSRLAFRPGGVDLKFIGFANYVQLLDGIEKSHFIGVLKPPNAIGWAIVVLLVAILAGVLWIGAEEHYRGDLPPPRLSPSGSM